MIKPGEDWTRPAAGVADIEVTGGDADLAAAVGTHPGALVRFRPTPDSDVARAVGLDAAAAAAAATAGGLEAPLDVLRLPDRLATNMVVVGTPPDALRRFARRIVVTVSVDGRPVWSGPATTVVVATGEFLRGLDIVPRGHPGDTRAEIQVYAVRARERRALRGRLHTGTHVPHPSIAQATGRRIEITSTRGAAPVEVDGRPAGTAEHLEIEVVPHAYRLFL